MYNETFICEGATNAPPVDGRLCEVKDFIYLHSAVCPTSRKLHEMYHGPKKYLNERLKKVRDQEGAL